MDLALGTRGGAWNLNLLRAGGNTAESFTAAFIDIKVREITAPPSGVPEPGTLALISVAGLAFAAAIRRRR